MTILNSLIVPKNLKGGTLWDFQTSIMFQKIKKIEGGILFTNVYVVTCDTFVRVLFFNADHLLRILKFSNVCQQTIQLERSCQSFGFATFL